MAGTSKPGQLTGLCHTIVFIASDLLKSTFDIVRRHPTILRMHARCCRHQIIHDLSVAHVVTPLPCKTKGHVVRSKYSFYVTEHKPHNRAEASVNFGKITLTSINQLFPGNLLTKRSFFGIILLKIALSQG